jgi:SAM-dependent methyltransferase
MTSTKDETVPDVPIARSREAWKRAADFPPDKEANYPGHASAHGFETARDKRVLEYGCGGGSDTLSLLRRGATVVYTDIVVHNVQTTTEFVVRSGFEATGYGHYLVDNATIPEPNASFDMVTTHGVLHHIVDPKPVLREFRRLLKPRGVLYAMLYTELLERRFEARILELVARRGLSHAEAFGWCTDSDGTPYARSYTLEQGRALFEAAGFDVAQTVDYNRGDFRTFKVVRK